MAVSLVCTFSSNLYGQSVSHNTHCPVQTDELASNDHVVTYEGRKIAFCCEACVDAFLENPKEYLATLEPKVQKKVQTSSRAEEKELLDDLFRLIVENWSAFIAILASLLAFGSWYASIRIRGSGSTIVRPILRFIGNPLLVVVAWQFVSSQQITQESERIQALYDVEKSTLFDMQMREQVHHATFHDYGEPPIPARPDVPKQLAGEYYRGNDERGPELFNGGHYRTSKFRISLVDGEGKELGYGDDVNSGSFFLRFQITRAPNTPDFFFRDKVMKRIYLTASSDPFNGKVSSPRDRTELKVLEEMQRWEALYSLGDVPRSGSHELNGLVYVTEERYHAKRVIGGRFHYGIKFNLEFQDGKLVDDSELWMNSLYRTRKVRLWEVPIREWFSHQPIPELPEKSNVNNELSGKSDYLKDFKELPDDIE